MLVQTGRLRIEANSVEPGHSWGIALKPYSRLEVENGDRVNRDQRDEHFYSRVKDNQVLSICRDVTFESSVEQ